MPPPFRSINITACATLNRLEITSGYFGLICLEITSDRCLYEEEEMGRGNAE
ncbi:hypothetical protein HanPI659440_Chr17g0673311 [Helianthus annuus]|nr:hypothetical protein HanPI659440_Chr17g0673311 [Helianthus annuus]